MINFSIEKSGKKAIIYGDFFKEIREKFSIYNEGARFAQKVNRFVSSRLYSITPTGRFDVGLFPELLKTASTYTDKIEVDPNLLDQFKGYNLEPYNDLTLKLRDYQSICVKTALEKGRGCIILATAGGKTLILASLLSSIFLQKKCRGVIIVPNRSLVTQTYGDLIEYKVPFSLSKWTGDDQLNLNADFVITNVGILQSENSDLSWMENLDVVVVDEVHGFRKANSVNKLLKDIETHHRYGLTGTLPPNLIDQWNIIGKFGPIIYEKTSAELRDEKYIADVEIQSLNLYYNNKPSYNKEHDIPTLNYRIELDFLIENSFRNQKIAYLANNVQNNCLILVDYIKHGQILYDELTKNNLNNKEVYYIRGEVEIEDREEIRRLVELKKNVVIIAISKIFSVGVNIKNLHYIIFAGGGKAKIKTLQSIGRGLRLHKDKDKLVIFDIVDQLRYGNRHYEQRKQLYENERIKNYETEIREKA
jgi:superfamily II DNA or RNA helicase